MQISVVKGRNQEKSGVRDPVPELTINLTLYPLQSRLQHIYLMGNPMPESTLKRPKREIFVAGTFTEIRPLWVYV